jgi:hypothetical protein
MELEFYDVKSKSKFKTTQFRVEAKEANGKTRYFAVTKSKVGPHECWRVLSAVQAAELSKKK